MHTNGSEPIAGQLTITLAAVAGLAVAALRGVPGVIGLAPTALFSGTLPALDWAHARRGVVVRSSPSGIALDVGLVLAYGCPVDQTAQAAQAACLDALTDALGREDVTVRVLVQGLRGSWDGFSAQ